MTHPLFEEKLTVTAGRGLFATQDISPEASILQVKAPLAYALNTEELNNTCEWCLLSRDDGLGPDSTLRVCKGCKVVRYCSTVSLGVHSLRFSDTVVRNLWRGWESSSGWQQGRFLGFDNHVSNFYFRMKHTQSCNTIVDL